KCSLNNAIQKALEGKGDFAELCGESFFHTDQSPDAFWVKFAVKPLNIGARHCVLASIEDITGLKQAAQALRDSEAKYRAVIENITDVFYRTDARGMLDMVSPSGIKLLGYDSEREMLGRPNESFWMHSEQRSKFLSILKERGEVRDYEVILKRKDGSPVHVATASRLILDKAGKAIGVEGTFRDITKRKQAELVLAEERKFTNAVLDSVPGLLYLYDDTGLLIRWNKQHETITGYSGDELAQMHLLDWYKDDQPTQEKISQAINRVMRDGCGSEEAELQTKSGEKIPFYFTAVLLEIEGRKYFTGIGIDITERKRAEEAVRNLEKSNRELIEYAPLGIFQSSPEGRCLSANIRLAEISGYDSVQDFMENMQDIGLKHYVNRNDRMEILEMLERKSAISVEVKLFRKDHSIIWGDLSMRAVRDSRGNLLHYEGFISDITERKKNEERLSESLKEKDVLLKEIHHRVKNNLQIISSLLHLQVEHKNNPEVEISLKESQNRVASMAAIHEELYKSENFSQIDLRHYVKFFVPRLINSYNTHKNGIGLDLDLSYAPVTIDKAIPFALILNELVTNAIRHGFRGKDDGRISVSIVCKNDMITVRVGDNGHGLPDGFDLKRTASLGINLVSTLTNQLHGTMLAENRNGAVFTLVFPAAGELSCQDEIH
ncbi:MAG: PAS domain S-box protein, partial [Desulfovibrionaceae bacterium]|nr:PAS domain S-box protein [Desulfovibrionaceae bacterium]